VCIDTQSFYFCLFAHEIPTPKGRAEVFDDFTPLGYEELVAVAIFLVFKRRN